MIGRIFVIFLGLAATSMALAVPTSKGNVTYLECIDTLDDFRSNGWWSDREGRFSYSETSADLPGDLNVSLKELDGRGIFTVEGDIYYHGFGRDADDLDRNQPTYLYVKYYAVRQSESYFVYLVPVKYPDDHPSHSFIHVLDVPKEVKWGEAMIEMDINNPWISQPYVALTIHNLYGGGYIMAEKFALVQGAHFNDTEEVKTLCGW